MSINTLRVHSSSKPAVGVTPSSHVRDVISTRALQRIAGPVGGWLAAQGLCHVVLGGGALLKGAAADLDFFPAPNHRSKVAQVVDSINQSPGKDFAETSVGDTILQFGLPTQQVDSLADIVNGFDFAHCQVAAWLVYQYEENERDMLWHVRQVETTPAFEAAMMSQGTFYTGGGNWPLRSLARVPKIAAKLGLSKAETQDLAFQVTAEIAKRGMDTVIAGDPSFAAMMGVR